MATIAPDVSVLASDEAFEKLYRRYVKDVYHYALALLGNPADAEDVTQTTFLNAYRAYQRGDQIHKPQNWLIKIAHNVARSRYARISRRVKEVPLDEHVDRLSVADAEKPNVAGVLRALGRLPFNQRAALIMRELEGRSYTEIADTLGVSVSAVETLIFRARRSLRVRTAALRSIVTVPVPSSLAQLFGGGGAGAAGGIGAGFLVKAAVALMVGGLATGVGVEGRTRAVAAPRHPAAAPARAQATPVRGHTRHAARHDTRRGGPAHPRAGRPSLASRRSVTEPSATAAAADSAPEPASARPVSSSPNVTTVAESTVQTVVGTVDQVTASLPVQLPQAPPLPLQAPPLPKLP
ncbi:MAG TPA: RNA polymerase sigma factor [Gaiellaceae bacterium]|nr:RNA polymerase sigma factor [Gaiellaceae bacterium]